MESGGTGQSLQFRWECLDQVVAFEQFVVRSRADDRESGHRPPFVEGVSWPRRCGWPGRGEP